MFRSIDASVIDSQLLQKVMGSDFEQLNPLMRILSLATLNIDQLIDDPSFANQAF